jgi:hypothetical protein
MPAMLQRWCPGASAFLRDAAMRCLYTARYQLAGSLSSPACGPKTCLYLTEAAALLPRGGGESDGASCRTTCCWRNIVFERSWRHCRSTSSTS